MEENKEQDYIPETSPTTMPGVDAPQVMEPTETQPAKKNTSSRLVRDILIVLAIFVVFILGVGVYLAVNATKFVSTLPSICDAREERLQSSADELKATLSKVTVGSQTASAITSYPMGDCLTGAGSRATTRFSLSAPDINTAYAQVIQGLQSSTLPQDQTYAAESDGYGYIKFLRADIKMPGSTKYFADYYLETPINCRGFGTPGCQEGAAAIQTYDLLHKPISSVEITLTSDVN